VHAAEPRLGQSSSAHRLFPPSRFIRPFPQGQRAMDVGGVPVSLLLDGDYLPSLREGRQNLFA
jgi:hypothetical protein